MRNRVAKIAMLIAVGLFFLHIIPAPAQVLPVGNRVQAGLTQVSDYFTDGDSIQNVDLLWNHHWGASIATTPFNAGGTTVVHPTIDIQTNLSLVRFVPWEPNTTIPGTPSHYTWSFEKAEDGQHVPIGFSVSGQETRVARPRLSLTRSVAPEVIRWEAPWQTVTVTLMLEEPLSTGVNHINVIIGSPIIAYANEPLVQASVVSATSIQPWFLATDNVQAAWSVDPSSLEVGRPYVFQATMKYENLGKLLGSPVIKTHVSSGYYHWAEPDIDWTDQENKLYTAKSVEVADATGTITATFSADDIVDWHPNLMDGRGYGMNQFVSQILPDGPNFRVFVPATVRIEPETLNLKSKGVITMFVTLPKPYNVNDIRVETVVAQRPGGTSAIRGNVAGDKLILKFDRKELTNLSPGKEVFIGVGGLLKDGSVFKGHDSIRIIP